MLGLNCERRNDCAGLAIVAGIVVGIIAAIFRYMAVINVTPAFLWVVLGVAVVLLTVAFIVYNGRRVSPCAGGPALAVFLISLLGTVLATVILLGISFSAASVIGAIITGVAVGLFFAALTALICIILQAANCRGVNIQEN